ncbi:uncharacterized protein MYCFIDRAFT_172824 [Pseudocercospora fijiensis CIRAD86]|uniref:Uncharacterized protein n=1 Tax=Pseudocercospora fijiensis (strain CIRAD86) TaxID=383855 RepID=M2ZXT1_PSEFD|nr:uncharacterized protein MYCFIDRAFT_172824 [Pseudocercospora fijiensis CIRAD86]EME83749.1 hypothetical protein MYCFIDRAFT_172824 [Pseudocercospora fijiensis CIRAD86]
MQEHQPQTHTHTKDKNTSHEYIASPKARTPTTMSTPTNSNNAANRVFAIPELLENILLNLDTTEQVPSKILPPTRQAILKCGSTSLQGVKRVSCTFYDTIQDSPQLQRRLKEPIPALPLSTRIPRDSLLNTEYSRFTALNIHIQFIFKYTLSDKGGCSSHDLVFRFIFNIEYECELNTIHYSISLFMDHGEHLESAWLRATKFSTDETTYEPWRNIVVLGNMTSTMTVDFFIQLGVSLQLVIIPGETFDQLVKNFRRALEQEGLAPKETHEAFRARMAGTGRGRSGQRDSFDRVVRKYRRALEKEGMSEKETREVFRARMDRTARGRGGNMESPLSMLIDWARGRKFSSHSLISQAFLGPSHSLEGNTPSRGRPAPCIMNPFAGYLKKIQSSPTPQRRITQTPPPPPSLPPVEKNIRIPHLRNLLAAFKTDPTKTSRSGSVDFRKFTLVIGPGKSEREDCCEWVDYCWEKGSGTATGGLWHVLALMEMLDCLIGALAGTSCSRPLNKESDNIEGYAKSRTEMLSRMNASHNFDCICLLRANSWPSSSHSFIHFYTITVHSPSRLKRLELCYSLRVALMETIHTAELCLARTVDDQKNRSYNSLDLRDCIKMLSTNAATKVFSIPELLEQIILELPQAEGNEGDRTVRGQSSIARLFALRRVSRAFHATITGSLAIQRRMCEPIVIDWVQTAPLWWDFIVWPKGWDAHNAFERAANQGSRLEESWRRIKFLSDDDVKRKVAFNHGINMYVDPGETYGQVVDRLHRRRDNQLKSLERARKVKKNKSARWAKWTKSGRGRLENVAVFLVYDAGLGRFRLSVLQADESTSCTTANHGHVIRGNARRGG